MTDIWANTDGIDLPPHWGILRWLEVELAYADAKRQSMGNMRDRDDKTWDSGLFTYDKNIFRHDADGYLLRAELTGPHLEANFRQLVGKAITTLIAALESHIRVYGGTMPEAGKPSGRFTW